MTKQEETITTFTCDECGAKSEKRDKSNCFPYEKGWVYVFRLDYKIATNHNNTIKDKHFCSKICFINHIQKQIQEALSHCCLFG